MRGSDRSSAATSSTSGSGSLSSGFTGQLLVAQAYGGLLPVEEAAERPVGMIESGPVSGLVGSQSLGARLGFRNIIAADMGGTTFKVGTVREGLIEYQRESMVLRYHYALPKMDVVSLGLAGGSIISIEPRTGTPRIGPRSAGSYPGPICYAHGGEEPTITDIDAILGYLNPDFFLGGRADARHRQGAATLRRRRSRSRSDSIRSPPPRRCTSSPTASSTTCSTRRLCSAASTRAASRSSRSVAPRACTSARTASSSASLTSSSLTRRRCTEPSGS